MLYDRFVWIRLNSVSMLMIDRRNLLSDDEVHEAKDDFFPLIDNNNFGLEDDQRMISVQYDIMIDYLKKSHDWEKYPICSMKIVEVKNGSQRILAKWIKEPGKGLAIKRIGRCQMISSGFLSDCARRNRAKTNIRPQYRD